MVKLRGGTATFQIEIGRWHGLKREEWVCKECNSEEIEDVCHWLLQCSAWNSLRQPLLEAMDNIGKDFSTKDDGDRTALILSHACRNYITFYLSLTLCGQLGSSNHSALLILSYQELVTYTFTLASLFMTQLYLFL